MYDSGEVNNIVHAGLILLVYLFVAIILYALLSVPIELILDAIGTSSAGTPAESPMSYMLPNLKTGLNIAFALGFAFPITWFVLWVFSKEPDFSMFRRN